MKKLICHRCGETKPSRFYASNRKHCMECVKENVRKYRKENLEAIKEYDRLRGDLPHRVALRRKVADRWKSDPDLKKRNAELKRRWSEKDLVRRAAHTLTSNAIRDGRLIKERCEVCGRIEVEAHHDDYMKPLDVRWLCTKHHAEHHKAMRRKCRERTKPHTTA